MNIIYNKIRMKPVNVRQSTQNIHSKNTFYLVLYNIEVYATVIQSDYSSLLTINFTKKIKWVTLSYFNQS